MPDSRLKSVTAVHNIKNLIGSYFGQEPESKDVDAINNTFIGMMEAVLKPSQEGKELYASLISRKSAEDRKTPNSDIYKRIYAHLDSQIKNEKFAFERNNPKQLASVMLMINVDRASKIRKSMSSESSLSLNDTKDLIKVANSLDEKGLCSIADKIDSFFLKTVE